MRHLLIDPAFPDIVGQQAAEQIDDRARVWIVERGDDGRLEECLDPSFLDGLEESVEVDRFVEVVIVTAAEQHVAETRIW